MNNNGMTDESNSCDGSNDYMTKMKYYAYQRAHAMIISLLFNYIRNTDLKGNNDRMVFGLINEIEIFSKSILEHEPLYHQLMKKYLSDSTLANEEFLQTIKTEYDIDLLESYLIVHNLKFKGLKQLITNCIYPLDTKLKLVLFSKNKECREIDYDNSKHLMSQVEDKRRFINSLLFVDDNNELDIDEAILKALEPKEDNNFVINNCNYDQVFDQLMRTTVFTIEMNELLRYEMNSDAIHAIFTSTFHN